IDYYLVLLPYKDETVKAASLCCQNGYDFNINIRKQLDNKKFKLGDCKVSAGVTADYTDMLYDNMEEDYHKAVENLKESGMNVVSTELAFDYTCDPDRDSFDEYYATERSDRVFIFAIVAVFPIIGIILMFASFWESKSRYQQSSNYSGVYFEPNFNNRFE
ncbi:MAG: hypothetical protein K2K42_05265, partial [Eubacterium sp.]|nr:hypothetical protein [Eubacterium sp.]